MTATATSARVRRRERRGQRQGRLVRPDVIGDPGRAPALDEHVCRCGVRIYLHPPTWILLDDGVEHGCRRCGVAVDEHPYDDEHVCEQCGLLEYEHDHESDLTGHRCRRCGADMATHPADLRPFGRDVWAHDGRIVVAYTADPAPAVCLAIVAAVAAALAATGVIVGVMR